MAAREAITATVQLPQQHNEAAITCEIGEEAPSTLEEKPLATETVTWSIVDAVDKETTSTSVIISLAKKLADLATNLECASLDPETPISSLDISSPEELLELNTALKIIFRKTFDLLPTSLDTFRGLASVGNVAKYIALRMDDR